MKMLTIKDVAKMADVSDITIRRWIKAGYGPAYNLTPTGFYRFGEDDVQEWLASMKREAGQSAEGKRR